MGGGRHWFSAVRRTFARSSCKTIAVVNIDDDSNSTTTHNARPVEEAAAVEEDGERRVEEQALNREDLAAIEIQAHFRGHLARRAYRALRSLVRVQAVVRGVCVRRQARLAIHCMQALVRLQVRVRARQLLSSSGCAEL